MKIYLLRKYRKLKKEVDSRFIFSRSANEYQCGACLTSLLTVFFGSYRKAELVFNNWANLYYWFYSYRSYSFHIKLSAYIKHFDVEMDKIRLSKDRRSGEIRCRFECEWNWKVL